MDQERNTSFADRMDSIIRPIAESENLEYAGFEQVSEHGKNILRVYLHRPGKGVTLADCETVSRQVSDALDVEDIMPGAYVLEVSSLGLTRPLRTAADFSKHVGGMVKIRLKQKISDRKNIIGDILATTTDTVEIADVYDGKTYSIPLGNISKASLEIESGEFKRS